MERSRVYALVKDNLASIPHTSIDTENDVEIEGLPGKEFEVSDDLNHGRIRALFIGKRIYILTTSVTNWPFLTKSYPEKVVDFQKESDRFFNSFKIFK